MTGSRRFWPILVAAMVCALCLAGCKGEALTRAPSTPRPVRTSAPDVTSTPLPAGPALAGTIPLRQGIGPNPSGLWLDETRGYLYVLCTGELDIVETVAYRTTRVPLPVGTQILALDAASRRLLAGGSGGSGPASLFLLDAATGVILRSVDLPAPPWRTLFLPERNLAVVSLSSGKVVVVDVGTGLLAQVSVGGARPILAADADAGKVYLSGAVSSQGDSMESALSVIDVQTGKVEVVALPAPPTAFALHPRTHRLFILHQYHGEMSVYSPDGGVEDTLTLGGEPSEIVLDAGSDAVYVSDWTGGRVLLLDAQKLLEPTVLGAFVASHFLQPQTAAHRLILAQSGTSQAALVYRDGVTPLDLPAPAASAVVHPSTGVSYVLLPSTNLILALAPDGTEFLRWKLPDRPEAIALDAARNKLFVSMPAAGALTVIDLNTRAQHVIPPALVPSAAALNPADGLLYVTDPLRATVHALGLAREQGARAISVGPYPTALAVNDATGEVLAGCADGLYSIRPSDSRGVRIVPSQSAPLVGVSSKLNRIYVGLTGSPSSIQILDGTAHRLLKTLSVGGALLALGVHEETGRLITVWQSPARPRVLTISQLTGQTLEERRVEVPLSIPAGAKVAVRLDAVQGQVCVVSSAQTIRVALVDLDTGEVRFDAEFTPEENTPAAFAPFNLQTDTVMSKVYLSIYGNNDILVLDSRSAISSTVPMSAGVTSLGLDAERSRIYASLMDGSLAILDGKSKQVVEAVAFNGAAHLLAADSQRQRVFACDPRGAVVYVIRDPSLGPEPGSSPTPVPSGTPQTPLSPWTTLASGDQVRTLIFDGTFVWAGTADGGIVRWSPTSGSSSQYLAPQDGLRSNEVHGIVVGAAGTVWAATARGVSRFTGLTWITQESDVSGAPEGPVRAITANSSGQIWVGTEAGGLHVMQSGKWETIPPESLGLQGNWITEVTTDAQGRQWLASWIGVSVVDGGNVITYTAQNSGLPPGVVSALLVLTDGTVLAGTDTGLALFQGGAWTTWPAQSGAPDHVTAMAQTADGVIWTASPTGIHRYAAGEWSAVGNIRTAAEVHMRSWAQVAVRSQHWPIVFAVDKVWAILESGLSDFDGQVWMRHSTTGASPPSNQMRTLATGSDGALWAGFAGRSAAMYGDGSWTVFTSRDQSYANANAILADTEGRVWVAADEGVSRYDGERWTLFKAGEAGLLKARALALAWDPAGTLWVGTEQGLNARRKESWTAYTTANSGLAGNRVLAVAVDSKGILWCATSAGISRYDGSTWQTFTDASASPAEQEIWGLAMDNTVYRWFGGRNAIRRLADTSWFNYRDLREAIEYDYGRILNTINSPNGLWTVDKAAGKIWVIADGGAAVYDGSQWETYTPDNSGLISDIVRAIAVDSEGAAWFATDKGLSRLEP